MLLGRAFFTADDLIVDDSRKKQCVIEEDYKLYLYLPYFSPYHEHPITCDRFNREITGLIALEAVVNMRLTQTSSQMMGMLVFTCSPEERDRRLKECTFSMKNLKRHVGGVMLRWFKPTDIFELDERLEENEVETTFSWNALLGIMIKNLTGEVGTILSSSTHTYNLKNWSFLGEMNTWCMRQNLWQVMEYGGDDVIGEGERALNSMERIWLYMHVSLRWKVKKSANRFITHEALKRVLVDDPIDNEETSTFEGVNALWFADERRGRYSKLEEQFKKLVDSYKEVCVIGARVGNLLEAKRRERSWAKLYTSLKLNKMMQDHVTIAPLDMFSPLAAKKWVEECVDIVERGFSNDNFYNCLFEGVVVHKEEGAYLRLYGNADRFMNENCPGKYIYGYCPQRIGKLSEKTGTSTPPPALFMKTSDFLKAKLVFPATEEGRTGCQLGLLDAAAFTTPLWMVWKAEADEERDSVTPVFYGLRRLFMERGKVVDRGRFGTVEDMLDNGVLKSGFAHELINSEMHVSTIVLDVDLKIGRVSLDLQQTYTDMVELLGEVMTSIIGEEASGVVHYIFRSSDPTEGEVLPEKYGFHHHVCIPYPYAFMVKVVATIVTLLNSLRRKYPKTIGLDCGVKNQDVYDPAIYVGKASSGHGVRSPFQAKFDGSKTLECVYRTDGRSLREEVPKNRLFAHGPHPEGFMGTLITDVTGITAITDNEYMRWLERDRIDNFIDKKCETKYDKIIDAINKRTVFFSKVPEDAGADRKILEEVLSELWECEGKKAFKRQLTLARGHMNNRYDPKKIAHVVSTSRLVIDGRNGECIVVTKGYESVGTIPICPNRVHRSPVGNGVRVVVIYSATMIKFCLKARCFKSGCRGNGFLTNCHMSMKDIFVSTTLRNAVERFLFQINVPQANVTTPVVGEAFDLFHDYMDADEIKAEENRETQLIVQDKVVIPAEFYRKPLNTYISEAREICYLYLFLEARGLCAFRTAEGYFVLLAKGNPTHTILVSRDPELFLRALSETEWGKELMWEPSIHALLENVVVNKDGQNGVRWKKAVCVGEANCEEADRR